MRVKAIQDLSQLSDSDLFEEAGNGASLCASNASTITDDCLFIANHQRTRGAEILRLAAEEEASKVLILLDAIRCPRRLLQAEFSRHLQSFNDHLAKGIYAQYCHLNFPTFRDVRQWIDLERKEYYLDGPNDIDWIFYNDILRRREETIYVDFVESEGQHHWHDPNRLDRMVEPFHMTPHNPVNILVKALNTSGFLEPAALEVIAQTWRPITIDDEFAWHEVRKLNRDTLQAIRQKDLLKTDDDQVLNSIANKWLYPLYPLDLRKEGVDKGELKQLKECWNPAWGDV